MTTATLPPMPQDTMTALLELAERREALWATAIGHDDPDWRERHDQRDLDDVVLTERQVQLYAEATGRCADHLTYSSTRWDEGTPCRNRAKAPGHLCGVHQARWDHRAARARHRVESNRRLADTQKVADALRAHDLDATAGTEHVSISADDARRLLTLLGPGRLARAWDDGYEACRAGVQKFRNPHRSDLSPELREG